MKSLLFTFSLIPVLFGACTPLFQATAAQPAAAIDDSLDGGVLADYWSRECPFDYSCALVAKPDGQGQALRFEWRPADIDGSRKTLGAELSLRRDGEFSSVVADNEVWYAFSMYLPDDSFRDDNQQMIVSQLHGVPDQSLGEPWRNPVTALYIEENQLWFRCHYAPERVSTSESKITSINEPIGPLVIGQWLDFVLRVRYDYSGHEGIVQLWQNDELVLSYSDIGCGYNDAYLPVFKMGMYYWTGESKYDERVVYFDNIRV